MRGQAGLGQGHAQLGGGVAATDDQDRIVHVSRSTAASAAVRKKESEESDRLGQGSNRPRL
jgi:hypothetical protein